MQVQGNLHLLWIDEQNETHLWGSFEIITTLKAPPLMWICLYVAVCRDTVKLIQMKPVSITVQRQGEFENHWAPNTQPRILCECNLCIRAARARQRPLAAGCLVHANPSSPEARLLGHVGMKAATGWHAAQGPGSNPQLGASISIRMNMSISSSRCWEAEYENRCWWQEGRGRDRLAWMNDRKCACVCVEGGRMGWGTIDATQL